jgi:Fe-Mn family superoxide dismutase
MSFKQFKALTFDVVGTLIDFEAGILAHVREVAGEAGKARSDDDFGAINQLQKNLAFHLSGHVLHSMFWENLSPDGGGHPEGDLLAAITDGFGGFDHFRSQLTEAALAVQGSGWGALTWEPLGQRLIVEQIYDHQSNVGQGAPPLLVLDMWEHAYYLQYKNVKADYVKAFWNVVNWADVQDRFAGATTKAQGLIF